MVMPNLFMYLLAIYMSSSEKCFFQILLGRWMNSLCLFRDKAEQASDLVSYLPGHCPDWEWLGVKACCEWKACSTLDKTGEKSWDCWDLEGAGGPSSKHNYIPSLHNKTNSINRKPKLWFGHRWMMMSVCDLPAIIRGNPKLQSLNFHPLSGHAAWDPFLTGTPGVLWHRTSQHKLSLDGSQNPNWWCILCSFYFSFLLILVLWK